MRYGLACLKMEGLDTSWRSRAPTVNESYVAWLQTQEALEKDEEDKECKRRQSTVEMLHTQQRALVMCLEVVSSAFANTALPNILEGQEQSCWKLDRRQNNFEELFGKRKNEETFKRHMRMTESSFEKLLDLVRDRLQPSRFSKLDYMSPRRIRTLTVLRLAHGYTFHSLVQLFAIGVSSAQKYYARGIEAICGLRVQFIRMPSTEADIASCIASFTGRGFPFACLAVDGCHVKVELVDQFDSLQDFICYKGFYSLNNMAYVDWNGMFRALLCGWAGSSADGGVIKEMHFTKMLQVGKRVHGWIDLGSAGVLTGLMLTPLARYGEWFAHQYAEAVQAYLLPKHFRAHNHFAVASYGIG